MYASEITSEITSITLATALGVNMRIDSSEEILNLIKNTESAQTKAILLILFKVSEALKEHADTNATLIEAFQEHQKAFAAHREEYAAEVNKKKGFHKFMLPALAFLQTLVITTLGYFGTYFMEYVDKVNTLERQVAIHNSEDATLRNRR